MSYMYFCVLVTSYGHHTITTFNSQNRKNLPKCKINYLSAKLTGCAVTCSFEALNRTIYCRTKVTYQLVVPYDVHAYQQC